MLTVPDTPLAFTVVVGAAVLGLFASFLVLMRKGHDWTADANTSVEPEPFAVDLDRRPLAAVVVNPTKFDDTRAVREQVETVCGSLGWAPPLWLETTADDPGVGQTRFALSEGADVVVACGGDGTVRCVGQALAGTGTAMGLLPTGTGNLLARNLDADITDVPTSMRVALSGDDRPMDVGWVTVVAAGGDELTRPDEQAFLVMAGMGFDAKVMANAPEALKARVGPIAYVVSGLRQMRGKQSRIQVEIDDAQAVQRRVRTVVVGNCGKLLGGLVLMPDAEIDDGWLDVVALAPRGVVGWAGVAWRVLTRRRRGHPLVEYWRGRSIRLTAEHAQPAQLDGDPVGDALELRMRVDPGALLVRVPATS